METLTWSVEALPTELKQRRIEADGAAFTDYLPLATATLVFASAVVNNAEKITSLFKKT
jgi:hypothetical protein